MTVRGAVGDSTRTAKTTRILVTFQPSIGWLPCIAQRYAGLKREQYIGWRQECRPLFQWPLEFDYQHERSPAEPYGDAAHQRRRAGLRKLKS
jgi:hypothetical protein